MCLTAGRTTNLFWVRYLDGEIKLKPPSSNICNIGSSQVMIVREPAHHSHNFDSCKMGHLCNWPDIVTFIVAVVEQITVVSKRSSSSLWAQFCQNPELIASFKQNCYKTWLYDAANGCNCVLVAQSHNPDQKEGLLELQIVAKQSAVSQVQPIYFWKSNCYLHSLPPPLLQTHSFLYHCTNLSQSSKSSSPERRVDFSTLPWYICNAVF